MTPSDPPKKTCLDTLLASFCNGTSEMGSEGGCYPCSHPVEESLLVHLVAKIFCSNTLAMGSVGCCCPCSHPLEESIPTEKRQIATNFCNNTSAMGSLGCCCPCSHPVEERICESGLQGIGHHLLQIPFSCCPSLPILFRLCYNRSRWVDLLSAPSSVAPDPTHIPARTFSPFAKTNSIAEYHNPTGKVSNEIKPLPP